MRLTPKKLLRKVYCFRRPLVTLSCGGTNKRQVDPASIEIPNLWHLAMRLKGLEREQVLEVWNLAHDLRKHILKTS